MLRALALLSSLALAGCLSTDPAAPLQAAPLTADEAARVDDVLERLYRSFSHGDGEEPDWELMRSLFVEGAQCVTETPTGQAPRPQPVDAFISAWRTSVRDRASPTLETGERILDARTTRVGRLIRVDVLFQAQKRDDPAPRTPGLDSLVLVDVGGDWKILSFVVHYESKLQEASVST